MKTSNHFSMVLIISILFTMFLMTSCHTSDLVEPKSETISANHLAMNAIMTNQGKLRFDMDMNEFGRSKPFATSSSQESRNEKFSIYQMIEFKVTKIENVSPNMVDNMYAKKDISSSKSLRGTSSKLIHLLGYGKGWSEEFGMSMVTTEMKVIPGKLDVSGTITCEFYPSGSTMVFEISGSGPLQTINEFDGPHSGLILKSALIMGTGDFENMKMEGVTYFLNASELLNPEVKEFSSYLMTIGKMMK